MRMVNFIENSDLVNMFMLTFFVYPSVCSLERIYSCSSFTDGSIVRAGMWIDDSRGLKTSILINMPGLRLIRWA